MWNYAELAQTAKALGGPERMIQVFVEKGIGVGMQKAKSKYGKLIAASGFAALCLGYFIADTRHKHKSRKRTVSDAEANSAQEEILAGIKSYQNDPNATPLPDITAEEAEAKIEQYVQDLTQQKKNDKEKETGIEPGEDRPEDINR